MTTLYIVRHGETAWNAEEIFRGRADVPLNATGLRQAALLGDYFGEKPLDAVFTSPMARAYRTAASIATARGLAPVETPELIDLDFGVWQGLARADVKQRWPELYRAWREHPERVRFPDGESLEDVRARLGRLLKRVAEHPGGVALVTHRVVAKVLILMLRGLAETHFWDIRLDNAAVTEFELTPGGWILGGHNRTGHLAALVQTPRGDF